MLRRSNCAQNRAKSTKPRFWPFLAAVFILGVMWQPGTIAATESTTWTWSSEEGEGDIAFRLTIDFGESNPCWFEFVTARNLVDGSIGSFYGRDDESLAFHIAAYEGQGWMTFHNIGGESYSEGWNTGSQGFLRLTHELTTTGVQSWIFAGYDTAKVDPAEFPSGAQPPPESFSLKISCSHPFVVESVERASSQLIFGPVDTCELMQTLPLQVCGLAGAIGQQESFELLGDRNVVRYHQAALNPSAGYIRLKGPTSTVEQVYTAGGVETGAQGIRLGGPSGTYGYELWHASMAPYVTGVFAFAFQET